MSGRRRQGNRRDDPRAPMRTRVLVFRDGNQWQSELVDLSAGGALLETPIRLEPGDQFAMGMHLEPHLQRECGLDYLHFTLEVVEVARLPGDGRSGRYRCRNLTERGSEQQSRAGAIVYRHLAA